ncbi:MAG TPA: ABC transporter permease, partial [Anseongella sp.]
MNRKVLENFRNYGMLTAFALICLVLSLTTPGFFSLQNMTIILRQVSINGILAIGVTFVIIAGGIDLSLGSVVAFTGVMAALFAHPGEFPLIVPLAVAVTAGLAIGALNGLVITRGTVAPFIVTLGMMTIARGLALVASGGRPVTNLSDGFNFIGGGDLMGIPVPILIFGGVILASSFLLNKTRIGRYMYAVGGNEQAAYAAGVRVKSVKLIAYMICSALAAVAGIVLASRITTGQPNAGIAYELDAIAAVVIGGTSLAGGIGSIGGTVLGVLLIGVINNGLDLL